MPSSITFTEGPLSITRQKASDADLLTYAQAFRARCPDWHNFLGESVYMALMDGEDAEWRDFPPFSPFAEVTPSGELFRELGDAPEMEWVSILRRHRALPEHFYSVSRPGTDISHAAPIYTGLVEVSLEGEGSIVAEAFLGAEVHVLDATGHVIHTTVRSDRTPRLGLGETLFTDLNSDYDTQVKGRYDECNVRITDYAMEESHDFTIQYNTFPFLDGRDAWILDADRRTKEERISSHLDNWGKDGYLEKVLRGKPLDFQFLPPEVRSDAGWVERFSAHNPVNFLFASDELRHDKDFIVRLLSRQRSVTHPSTGIARDIPDPIHVYPYLPRELRRDMDILKAMFDADLLFDLPWRDDYCKGLRDDFRAFMDREADRIMEWVEWFPYALHFGPDLLDRLPQGFTDNEDIMLRLIAAHQQALPRASSRLLQDQGFLLQAVRINPRCIERFPDSVRSDAALMRTLEEAARAAEDELPF
jgi:hypothetical protein